MKWYLSLAVMCLLNVICLGVEAAESLAAYTYIDWIDPLNPRFARLGNDKYLVETRDGYREWHVRKNMMTPTDWPQTYRYNGGWTMLENGVLLSAAKSVAESEPKPKQKLMFWNATDQRFAAGLEIPQSLFIQEIIPLNGTNALVCMAKFSTQIGYDARTAPKSGLVVQAQTDKAGNIKFSWVSNNAASQTILKNAGVRGKLGGFALGSPDDADTPPVYFDIASCRWKMKNPPEEVRNAKDLTIKHYRLPDGRTVVSQAEWYSPSFGHRTELTAPYLWDATKKAWQPIENTASGGTDPSEYHNFTTHDAIYSHNEYLVEKLNTATLHWTPLAQNIPKQNPPYVQLAPLSNKEVLLFSSDSGKVYLLGAGQTEQKTLESQLSYEHDAFGSNTLKRGGWFLVNDPDEWNPSNRPEIVTFSPKAVSKTIKPLPKVMNYLSSVELPDESILVFGGLPPRCAPDHVNASCVRETQPSYRYLPKTDNWELVRELSISFSNGQHLDGGNSSIALQWARSDAIVRANGSFAYLDGITEKQMADREIKTVKTVLKTWQPTQKPQVLAPLRKGRVQANLIELADKRLAVIGGHSQKYTVALEKTCEDCPDELVSLGLMEPAKTTEVLDEKAKQWLPGPRANYVSGKALKLANGRIFKLSLENVWYVDETDGYVAEIADAAFTKWEILPPIPVKNLSAIDVVVMGNRVLIIPDVGNGKTAHKTLVWDDDKRKWLVWDEWPSRLVLGVTPVDKKHVMARYFQSFELIAIPE